MLRQQGSGQKEKKNTTRGKRSQDDAKIYRKSSEDVVNKYVRVDRVDRG